MNGDSWFLYTLIGEFVGAYTGKFRDCSWACQRLTISMGRQRNICYYCLTSGGNLEEMGASEKAKLGWWDDKLDTKRWLHHLRREDCSNGCWIEAKLPWKLMIPMERSPDMGRGASWGLPESWGDPPVIFCFHGISPWKNPSILVVPTFMETSI